jgi:hypothetical protein
MVGCAPVIKDYAFQPEHPLHGKRIGVIYSRSGQPGSEGVDEHDLEDFLRSLSATLRTHGRNSEFVDLTGNRAIGPFPRAGLPDTGFLGQISNGFYAVPDSGAQARLPDSLDCLLLISGLSFSGGTPVEDTVGVGERTAALLSGNDFAPIRPGDIPGAPILRVGTHPSVDGDWGGADGTEGTAFRFLIWDRHARRPLAYSHIHMKQSKRFGSETTTFSEDAERIGQLLLRELTKPMASPGATAARPPR